MLPDPFLMHDHLNGYFYFVSVMAEWIRQSHLAKEVLRKTENKKRVEVIRIAYR